MENLEKKVKWIEEVVMVLSVNVKHKIKQMMSC